jgi:hypothetical protein
MFVTVFKVIYAGIFICMVTVVTLASLKENIFAIPSIVSSDPWFIATLFDTYFAFFAFWLWICYRERAIFVKLFWFIAIAGLGNIAMAIYVLINLFQLKPGDGIDKMFAKK